MNFNEINNGILYLCSPEGELVINGIPSNIELSVSEAEEKNFTITLSHCNTELLEYWGKYG